MTSAKAQALANMTTRQKVMGGVVVLIVLIILWQLSSMFKGGGKKTARPIIETNSTAMMGASGPGAVAPGAPMQPQQITPKPAELKQAQPMTDREAELMKLQQETQAKYLDALNQLQILKVTRDIAQTNKDISTAKLATVVSEKKIVDLLTPPAPPATPETYAKNLVNPTSTGAIVTPEQEVNYSVISVSELQYRWGAVLGYKGNLYNVHVGDILPPDGSTVFSINKDGVTLLKDGVKKKISLISII